MNITKSKHQPSSIQELNEVTLNWKPVINKQKLSLQDIRNSLESNFKINKPIISSQNELIKTSEQSLLKTSINFYVDNTFNKINTNTHGFTGICSRIASGIISGASTIYKIISDASLDLSRGDYSLKTARRTIAINGTSFIAGGIIGKLGMSLMGLVGSSTLMSLSIGALTIIAIGYTINQLEQLLSSHYDKIYSKW